MLYYNVVLLNSNLIKKEIDMTSIVFRRSQAVNIEKVLVIGMIMGFSLFLGIEAMEMVSEITQEINEALQVVR
jgi:hypothetical protein